MGNFKHESSKIESAAKEIEFSGVIQVEKLNTPLIKRSFGYSNRSESLENNEETRFGIASGCKLFTAIAIVQLAEQGELSFDQKLSEVLDESFPHFDPEVTIHHLLTHTSGIPDYFDEDVMEDFEELWKDRPMYRMNSLTDFLPLFQNEKMKFSPGEKFHYNNAGFILLGLIVEKVSGRRFTDYISEEIFTKCGMTSSGYFPLDQLPGNTALGYIDEGDNWRTNIYSIPRVGGADGGAFTTAGDLSKLWASLFSFSLLREESVEKLLTLHSQEEEDDFYGYGIWITKREDSVFRYHIMGYDPGVSFHSAYYPAYYVTISVLSNKSEGAFDMLDAAEDHFLK
ncbi:serine hydrolase domain-containing protein [Jeotgalibacillus proteolyticus]|uniref:Penicillin-binding protein n=1 Tax=Jeotgalibacillus proteolyticus TaxID=2082395 RepID=A0A2S5GAI9_9BACL|nr:serine hydrolase domain-containing protein [Jeotgalibacillus proteolyticus]PPA69924.1 penicillin-binding protein [Jeotgalibacillus proteolyticus]